MEHNAQAQIDRLGEEFPVVAYPTKDGWWLLLDEGMEQLREEFPTVNVERQCELAWSWIFKRTSNRKTNRGMQQFLRSWMGRHV